MAHPSGDLRNASSSSRAVLEPRRYCRVIGGRDRVKDEEEVHDEVENRAGVKRELYLSLSLARRFCEGPPQLPATQVRTRLAYSIECHAEFKSSPSFGRNSMTLFVAVAIND